MTPSQSAFQEWRRHLEELQSPALQTGATWRAKLQARVLRYFISRYEYQPIPRQVLEPRHARRPMPNASRTKVSLRLKRKQTEAAPQVEKYRQVLSKIRSINTDRKRFLA